jgi:glutathionylspermidine synthase
VPGNAGMARRIHFAALREGQHEDWGNVHYLLETAAEAGFDGSSIPVEEIGWDGQTFTDLAERPIEVLFKLYPWEWMMADTFGWKVRTCGTRFVEPAWKMLLSTKALLPLLWKRHPDHPLPLEAYFEADTGSISRRGGDWVRKPLLGREGANTTRVHADGKPYATPQVVPHYDKHGYVLQRWFSCRSFGGFTPVLGAWIVGDKACGLGIREDASPITTNASSFVPHYFTEEAP